MAKVDRWKSVLAAECQQSFSIGGSVPRDRFDTTGTCFLKSSLAEVADEPCSEIGGCSGFCSDRGVRLRR